MDNKKVINRVNIESLFNSLYTTGRARLSDHFIDDDGDDKTDENDK